MSDAIERNVTINGRRKRRKQREKRRSVDRVNENTRACYGKIIVSAT